MFDLYEEARAWVKTHWNKDTSFNTRIRIIGAVILIELIDWLKRDVKVSVVVSQPDEAESET